MNVKSSDAKAKRFVAPGDKLGVIEEFTPDTGTYVKDGAIHSKVLGEASIDSVQKRVSVKQTGKNVKVPKIGSTVIGQVTNVQSQNAGVRIFNVDKKDLTGVFSSVLHVSDVQMRFVDSMFDVCKPGDVLRAKVISDKNRTFHLSTKERELGVVYAFCSNCGYILEPKRQGMHCARCGRIERRKIAVDYGKGEI